jgi:hypothetical protein
MSESTAVIASLSAMSEPFADAAAMLREAMRAGAVLKEFTQPRDEVLRTMRVRLELMQGRGEHYPGFAAAVDALVDTADGAICVIGIVGRDLGGAVLSTAEGEPFACYVAGDPNKTPVEPGT